MDSQLKILLLFFISLLPISGVAQDLLKTNTAAIEFFSSAPVEDIHAISKKGISVLKSSTGEISFMVRINSMDFQKSLMQEHFNENFMESERYPTASFKGRIKDPPDLKSNGEFAVILSGILNIHGEEKERELPAKIIVKNGQIHLSSRFNVACEDHNIKIPKVLWKNIAEVVEVRVNAIYN